MVFLATAGLGVGVGGRGRQRVRCPCSFSPGRVAVWPPSRPWFSAPPPFCARSPVPPLSSAVFILSRDMSGISQNNVFEGVGYPMGYAKVGYAKRVSQAGQTSSFRGVRTLRRGCPELSVICLSPSISIVSLPLSLLPSAISTCSCLTTEASGTHD